MTLRFDHADPTETDGLVFDRPSEVIEAWEPAEVADALARMDAVRAKGGWLAGYATYEMGHAFEPRLLAVLPQVRRGPLLRFGVFDAPNRDRLPLPEKAAVRNVAPQLGQADYDRAFAAIHAAIEAGDIYQANLTFPIIAGVEGAPVDLYAHLLRRQPVPHAALVEQGPDAPAFVSCSPELFFRTTPDGLIETRPMKGTVARGETPDQDVARRDWLRQDPKNLAENTMIVDLLRNDLSRVCRTGSVRVPRLFDIEPYASVFQMTSTVQGQLMPDAALSDILRALFPCGSITGAPKIMAMQILAAQERAARGIYCGTIGWAAPDGTSCFNVAIRTLIVQDGMARLNVGGGVVWDSTAVEEYAEALLKSRFAQTTE
ncbi:aminodeoxychorismate synthase component I [Salipiger sp. IMCC34102]|uniref:aminodeoxychorismate synthase component I n=1 Tax=Salipiger sp. IMCC34102 TaxID=2510647 RepID=UPI003515CD1B